MESDLGEAMEFAVHVMFRLETRVHFHSHPPDSLSQLAYISFMVHFHDSFRECKPIWPPP